MSPFFVRKVPLIYIMGLNKQQVASLIVKYLQRNISNPEMEELQVWLKKSEENKRLLTSLEQEGYNKDEISFLEGIDVDLAWSKLAARKRKSKHTQSGIRWIASIAALVLLSFGLKLWIFRSKNTTHEQAVIFHSQDILPGSNKAELILSDGTKFDLTKPVHTKERNGTQIHDNGGNLNYLNSQVASEELIFNTLKVPKAGTYQLTLPDGTKVWLNAMSTLKFPVQFAGPERLVYLEGEAFFEVANDESKPFIVSSKGAQVSVLGTVFNINAYTQDMATTLISGSVKVSRGNAVKLLKPGQEAKVESDKIHISNANLDKVVAWKEGDFYFDKDNIMKIMQELSRWYDFEVTYHGDIPTNLISGNISRSSKLSEVLEMLNFVSNETTKFEVNNRKVDVLFSKKRSVN